jgi:hypothetical protein
MDVNTLYALLISSAVSLALGAWGGIEWRLGREAIALKEARAELKKLADTANDIALTYAGNTARLDRKLGDARVRLRDLTTGRDCLSADAVRLLNAGAGVSSATTEPAGPPAAAATDRDVGDALALCRGEHAKLAAQLNAILDIEDRKNVRQ